MRNDGLYRPVCAHTNTYTHTCTPRASSHNCSYTQRLTSPLIRENPGQGVTSLCHGLASYLSLHGHCAELLTWRAGCADAQFLHPSGPPALAAGLPQPGREKRHPTSSEGPPDHDKALPVRNPGPMGPRTC